MAAIDANVFLLVGHHVLPWLLFADLCNCYFYIDADVLFHFKKKKFVLFTSICEWQFRNEWHWMSNVQMIKCHYSDRRQMTHYRMWHFGYAFQMYAIDSISLCNLIETLIFHRKITSDIQAIKYILFRLISVLKLIEHWKPNGDISNRH